MFSQDAFLSKELHLFQQAVIIELRSMPHSCVDIVKSMMAGIDVLQNEFVSHTHTHKKKHEPRSKLLKWLMIMVQLKGINITLIQDLYQTNDDPCQPQVKAMVHMQAMQNSSRQSKAHRNEQRPA